MPYTKEQIEKLLKLYGASEEETKNFLEDLDKPEQAPSDDFDDNDFESWN